MPDTDKVLLENVLDAFDRLYDGKCGVADTEALLFATSKALVASPLLPKIEEAHSELMVILRSGASRSDQNLAALDAVQALREDLARTLGES